MDGKKLVQKGLPLDRAFLAVEMSDSFVFKTDESPLSAESERKMMDALLQSIDNRSLQESARGILESYQANLPSRHRGGEK